MDLYREEKAEMVEKKVLDNVFLALSRQPNTPKVINPLVFQLVAVIFAFFKTYVQDLIQKESSEIYKMLVLEKGHFYVCGDCTMAEHVYQTLKLIIQKYGGMSDEHIENYMLTLRVITKFFLKFLLFQRCFSGRESLSRRHLRNNAPHC